MTAAEFLAALVDPGSYLSWDRAPKQPPGSAAYLAELAEAAFASGADESVLTGTATVGGHRIALVVSEFEFLAGSIGTAAASRILDAIDRATDAGLPLLAAPASGGTRMQEGAPAFVQMAPIAAALRRHKDAGLLYATYLRHPTTGGALASWGSLGQVRFAEPGALVGFLGPKVYRALHGADFPAGVQTAENLCAVGLLDGTLPVEELRCALQRILDVLTARPDVGSSSGAGDHAVPSGAAAGPSAAGPSAAGPSDVWDAVLATRAPGRPGLVELLRHGATDLVPLRGTAAGEHDPSIVVALARIGGAGCVVIGQDRAAQERGHLLGPAALRQAQRGLRLAAELRLPVLTVIDTPGAELSRAAEEGGLTAEIARCLEALGTHPSRTVSVLLGQGCGGGALALLPATRVVAASRAWLSPLPPEGASVICHGTTDRAPEVARAQRVGAADLHCDGIVHRLVEEGEGLLVELLEVVAEELAGPGTAVRPAG